MIQRAFDLGQHSPVLWVVRLASDICKCGETRHTTNGMHKFPRLGLKNEFRLDVRRSWIGRMAANATCPCMAGNNTVSCHSAAFAFGTLFCGASSVVSGAAC